MESSERPREQRIAGYGQPCPACRRYIDKGDMIAASDHGLGWVHLECADKALER